jgi:hypothetical protein
MVFEEIQQRLDQDLEEYKDDEEKRTIRKETSPVPVATAVGTVPSRTSRGWFQHGEI